MTAAKATVNSELSKRIEDLNNLTAAKLGADAQLAKKTEELKNLTAAKVLELENTLAKKAEELLNLTAAKFIRDIDQAKKAEELKTLSAAKTGLEVELAKKISELKSVIAAKSAVDGDLGKANDELERLKSANLAGKNTLKESNLDLEAKLEVKQSEAVRLNEFLTVENADLSTQIQTKITESQNLEQQISDSKKLQQETQEKAEKSDQERLSRENELKKFSDQLQKLKNGKSDIMEMLKASQLNLSQAKQAKSEAEAQVTDLRAEILQAENLFQAQKAEIDVKNFEALEIVLKNQESEVAAATSRLQEEISQARVTNEEILWEVKVKNEK